MNMPSLNGKTALVTGASRGMGRASALALAAAGAQVLVHYGRGAKEADGVVAEIRKAGGRADAIATDLAAADGASKLARQVRSIVGDRLDILVANAGVLKAATIEETTVEDFDRLFAVNVRAPFFLVQQLLPIMCFPFQTTYYLNGHNFIEQELNRAQVGFRKNDNAFLAIDDVAALQAAADKLSPAIIRERLDYLTSLLGPKFSVKERKRIHLSRFYSISQIEYCRNFIFKRNFPIHKLFERGCELGLWRLTANKIAEIFGARLHRRLPGKLATVIDQIEHGHHVFRAYFKHAFLKQYEKFATFLRNELCSNNLNDFGLKKGLDNLDAVRQTFKVITSRFAGFQAQWLNVHVDFPLLQRIALPITIGSVRYPGIKIHDRRVIRLLEVLLHGGTHVGGWTAKDIPQSVLNTLGLSERS